jgi:hypothetical protein
MEQTDTISILKQLKYFVKSTYDSEGLVKVSC